MQSHRAHCLKPYMCTGSEVLVYDNSCHAMSYALNRESAWFKNVQWVIDAVHFPGHTGCAYAFDIKRQPLLSRLNSQICEQRVSAGSSMAELFL